MNIRYTNIDYLNLDRNLKEINVKITNMTKSIATISNEAKTILKNNWEGETYLKYDQELNQIILELNNLAKRFEDHNSKAEKCVIEYRQADEHSKSLL